MKLTLELHRKTDMVREKAARRDGMRAKQMVHAKGLTWGFQMALGLERHHEVSGKAYHGKGM